MTSLNAPKEIAEAMHDVRTPPWLSLERLDHDHPCEGSKFHSPCPLLVRRHDLSDFVALMAGEDEALGEALDAVWLCSTCLDNLTVYVSLLLLHDNTVDWKVRRGFGNTIRDLGRRAWQHHADRLALLSVPV
jgi:hypothetical protein